MVRELSDQIRSLQANLRAGESRMVVNPLAGESSRMNNPFQQTVSTNLFRVSASSRPESQRYESATN